MRDYCTLIKETRAGSKAAFEELVRRFQFFAQATAQRKLKDIHLAQDAVQEAFLAAYLNLDRLHNPESFPSWFSTILARCCGQVRKRNAPGPGSSNMDQAESIADDRPGPLEVVTRYQDRARVIRLLSMLSGRDREACILRFVQGFGYKRIAEFLNIPVGTAKRRIHTAKNKLGRLLEQEQGSVVRVGYLPLSDHLLAMVAQERNQSPNMAIHMRRFLSWGSLVRAVQNQLVDVAFIMAPLAMDLRAHGLDIRYILDGHHDGSAVVVAVNGGSPKRSMESSRWALPHSISTHGMLLHSLLGSPHTPHRPADRKYISPPYVIRSLRQREVDAFICAEPWGAKSEAMGAGRVVARSRDIAPGHICCVVVANQHFAATQGPLLREYTRQLLDAGDFIRRKPETAADIQSRYTGVDTGIARHVLKNGHIQFNELTPSLERARATLRLGLDTAVLKRGCDLDSFFLSVL